MTAVILQPSYLPWRGYFHLMQRADVFVHYDDVQYTRQDWRNRNRIKTAAGPAWLTIPVGTDLNRRICDVTLPSSPWQAEHLRRLESSYRDTPFFETYRPLLRTLYDRPWQTLSELNQHAIREISALLGITTTFRDSREMDVGGGRLDRLIAILQRAGAGVYVSGPAAKSYIDERRFDEAGIALAWKNYDGYPTYPQLHMPFIHEVTILDLLFHTGPEAPRFIWGWRG